MPERWNHHARALPKGVCVVRGTNGALPPSSAQGGASEMLWAIVALLVVLWLGGFLLNVAGGLIHALLVIALLVAAYNFFIGRRSAV